MKEMIGKTSCKNWPSLTDKDGYGVVKIHGKMRKAHRVAVEIELGRKLKSSEIVMHLCHNPSCYKLSHLKIGTTKENSKDTIRTRNSIASKLLKGYEKIYV